MLTDHKAIISELNEKYKNKSYQSRLSRWADRLFPFDFEVIYVPGVTLGIVDYISRYSTFLAPKPSNYEKLLVVKSVEAFNKAFAFINSYSLPISRSRQLGQISRIYQIHQLNRTRERAAKTRFVAARTNSRKEGHDQLLEAMRRCHLSKPWKLNTTAKIGVFAVNGGKPILSKSKKDIVGLPGLFNADLLAELTEEDRFLGPMKCSIVNKYVTSFKKLGSYMAQFWTKAAVIVIVDNKLAIPELLRQAVLASLHRSHPGKEAMMSASEYIWWPFLIRQIVDTCEKCPKCTLYGTNLKPAKTFHSAQTLPSLSWPNQ